MQLTGGVQISRSVAEHRGCAGQNPDLRTESCERVPQFTIRTEVCQDAEIIAILHEGQQSRWIGTETFARGLRERELQTVFPLFIGRSDRRTTGCLVLIEK